MTNTEARDALNAAMPGLNWKCDGPATAEVWCDTEFGRGTPLRIRLFPPIEDQHRMRWVCTIDFGTTVPACACDMAEGEERVVELVQGTMDEVCKTLSRLVRPPKPGTPWFRAMRRKLKPVAP